MTSPNHLIALLGLFAQMSGQQIGRELIEFTARKLMPLGLPAVCAALERMLENGRKFPTVAEVKAEMGIAEPSSRDAALEIATRILSGISRYGEIPPGNTKTAVAIEAALGSGAWSVVVRMGGWNRVVELAGENQTAFRAQARDLADSYLRTGQIDMPPQGALPSLGDVVQLASSLPEASTPAALPSKERDGLEQRLAELKAKRDGAIALQEADSDRIIELRRSLKRIEGEHL